MCAGFYDIGGFSIVMERLASALIGKGHDITIGAVHFRNFPHKGLHDVVRIPVGNVLKLRRFLEDFEVVHSHHTITNYLALLCRKPFVYHYHGTPDYGKRYLFRLCMISSIKLMKNSFDAVVAVSESGATELKQYFGFHNVHVVYNGVDTSLFKPGLEERFRKGKPQFLFVGNLYKHKNVEELILAMKELVKVYPKACLQIVGHGQMYEVLKLFITKLKLEDNVELVGRVSEAELPYRYASCDAYVTASKWELFGLPLLEAMACGKLVVASSILPHVELLTKSKAGEQYPLGDVEILCKKMIRTWEESKKCATKAVIFAKDHDWSVVADRISSIYAQIV
jgi:glycosyltransferase involved in cell wall biosynthesis